MPSTSSRQHNLMAMVAHDPKAAKRVGIPQSVGQEFMKADKGKKFGSGGNALMNKPKTHHGKAALFKSGGQVMAKKMGGDTSMSNRSKERSGMTMEKMGGVKAGGKRPHGEHSVQQKGHTKGKQIGVSGTSVGIQSGARGGRK